MLGFVREGDTIFVTDWSRLSRSAADLLRLIKILADKKVKLVSLKENFDTSSPTGKLMLGLIALINEFERSNLLERQREGIAIAKEKGKYTGRKPNQYNEEQLKMILAAVVNKRITVTEAAKRLNVTRATVYNILKKYGIDLKGRK